MHLDTRHSVCRIYAHAFYGMYDLQKRLAKKLQFAELSFIQAGTKHLHLKQSSEDDYVASLKALSHGAN